MLKEVDVLSLELNTMHCLWIGKTWKHQRALLGPKETPIPKLQRQSKYPEMIWAQCGLQEDFWWLDISQHSSGTCEASSPLTKELFLSSRRDTWLSIASISMQSMNWSEDTCSYCWNKGIIMNWAVQNKGIYSWIYDSIFECLVWDRAGAANPDDLNSVQYPGHTQWWREPPHSSKNKTKQNNQTNKNKPNKQTQKQAGQWFMPLIPKLRAQRQDGFWVWGLLYRLSSGRPATEKPYLDKNKKQNKTNNRMA